MAFLDRSIFNAASGGTGAFVVSSVVTGYQSPANAGAADGRVYSYVAQSADLSQWEYGRSTYTASGTSFDRGQVLGNSLGTTAKINFTLAPQVLLTALAEDLAPTVLTPAGSNLQFYIATTGNDSNPGTIGSPFLTIAHALNVAASYNWQGLYNPTINIAAGTYVEAITLPALVNPSGGVSGQLSTIVGASPPTGTQIQPVTAAGPNGAVIYASPGSSWKVQDLWLDASNSVGNSMVEVDLGASLRCACGQFTVTTNGVFWTSGELATLNVVKDSTNAFNLDVPSGVLFFFGETGGISSQLTISGATVKLLSGFALANWIQTNAEFSNISYTSMGLNLNGQSISGGTQVVAIGLTSVTDSSLSNTPGSGVTIDYSATLNDTWGGKKSIQSPSTGATISLTNQNYLILTPSGTLATLTINLPASPVDFRKVFISTSQVITALTVAVTDGSTVVAAPTTLAIGQAFTMIYDQTNNSWYPTN